MIRIVNLLVEWIVTLHILNFNATLIVRLPLTSWKFLQNIATFNPSVFNRSVFNPSVFLFNLFMYEFAELCQDLILSLRSLFVVELGESSFLISTVDLVLLPQANRLHPAMSATRCTVNRTGQKLEKLTDQINYNTIELTSHIYQVRSFPG